MDDSVKQHGKCWRGSLSACVMILFLFCSTIVGAIANAQTSQGGVLVLVGSGSYAPNDTVYAEQVVLQDYIGEPLKALQLRVISQGGLRLQSVERGADLTNAFQWNVSHVIARGQNGVDTAKVVIFGMGHNALPPSPHTELLTVKYEVVSPNGAALVLSDVLGALSRGENAQVVAGPSRTVAVKRK